VRRVVFVAELRAAQGRGTAVKIRRSDFVSGGLEFCFSLFCCLFYICETLHNEELHNCILP